MNDDSLLTLDAGHVTRAPHADCHQTLARLVTDVCDILGSYTLHRLLSPPIRARLWSDEPMRTRGLSSLTSLLQAQPVFNAVQSYARSLYNSARYIFRHDYIITVHRIVHRIHSVCIFLVIERYDVFISSKQEIFEEKHLNFKSDFLHQSEQDLHFSKAKAKCKSSESCLQYCTVQVYIHVFKNSGTADSSYLIIFKIYISERKTTLLYFIVRKEWVTNQSVSKNLPMPRLQ